MPKFSNESLINIAECHPDLGVILKEAIKYLDFSVIEGHRNKALQDHYFAIGTSKVRFPNGKHNSVPSMAVDILPYQKEGPDWRPNRFIYFAGWIKCIAERLLAEKKISHKLIWGGDWDNDTLVYDQNFHDLGHFELHKP